MKSKKIMVKHDKPDNWPVFPTQVELVISTTYPQTQFRTISGKPPFLRCLISAEYMAKHGLHTDIPLIFSNKNNTRTLILHGWPSSKMQSNFVSIEEEPFKYLEYKNNDKICAIPVEEFNDAHKIVLEDCPDRTCNMISSLYNGILVANNSILFFGQYTYSIKNIYPEGYNYYRVTSNTVFSSTLLSCSGDVPSFFQSTFEKIQKLIDLKKSFILSGPSGCGKSLFMSTIISKFPSKSFVSYSIPGLLSSSYGEAERSIIDGSKKDIIILDSLESLTHDETSQRIVQALIKVFDSCMIIGISSDIDFLSKSLLQINRFQEIVEIEAPDCKQREEILFDILAKSNVKYNNDDVKNAANNSLGFVGGDLQRLVSEAIINNVKSTEPINLTNVLAFIKPASLMHINLEVPNVKWDSIGGYEDVKTKIRESVTLPLSHPESFERLGIKPPKGILMFGPPGCSKTLMAKAVATESKMNFIAVKGPELFSKFVGESEKAVAKVFKKARACAPSIIFFDEIDSMAIKRGSGSESGSNVTDRVLTQLLTEMDGISTKFNQSVVIIAATNRPDLLDEALLRPGRFDRLIYISLPDEQARKEIFNVYTKHEHFSKDIDIEDLARRTDCYSGAEIAAICRESAMNALRENPPSNTVNLSHFEKALTAIKPRTPESLLAFYDNFNKHRTSNFNM